MVNACKVSEFSFHFVTTDVIFEDGLTGNIHKVLEVGSQHEIQLILNTDQLFRQVGEHRHKGTRVLINIRYR